MTPAALRRFALTVGGVFGGIALLSWWRGHMLTSGLLGAVAGSLLVAGLLVPARLNPVYRAWMGLATLMSRVTTPLFLGAMYFAVFTPIGLVRRAMRKDALDRPASGGSYWIRRTNRGGGSMDRLF